MCVSALQSFQFIQPQGGAGIAGHAPVAAGRKRDRANLGAVGQAAALELLGKEAAIEVFQPVQKNFIAVFSAEGILGKEVYLGRAKTSEQHIIQIEIVQLIGAHQCLGLLADLAVLGG